MRIPRRIKKKLLYGLVSIVAASGCFASLKADAKDMFARAANKLTGQVAKELSAKAQSDVNIEGFASWNGKDLIPEYSGEACIELNGNVPYFTDEELTDEAFERYSALDELGRCGQAYANICIELMPTEERGEIGMIKPSGWHTVKYPELIEDVYLYNRCHLIAFCLAGENANEQNLITGTRHLNKTVMLPYEVEVAEYVEQTGGHVLYRATPIFVGDELVCRGIELEALSVEDKGDGISFHVFLYNEQPGIHIDHASGESWAK